MKEELTQVKELKDKMHEQYIEIQELNKARKFDIEYNKYLQKEIIRLNNIINELEKMLEQTIENSAVQPHIEMAEYTLKELKELKGEDKE